MMHVARVSLSIAAVALVACQGDRAVQPSGPTVVISDAVNSSGNQAFFFEPPLVPNASANYHAGEFNENASPVVRICEGSDVCTAVIATFTMTSGPGSETVRLELSDEHYIVNWHTDQFALDPAKDYRITVLLGTTVLGFADVEPTSSPGQFKNVTTQETVPLVDGRTLPIKFRIEDSALCGGSATVACNSTTIDLAAGGFVVLEATGDRVDIPPQTSNTGTITVTLQLCDGLDVDLPLFGNCLSVTADPPLDQVLTTTPPVLNPRAIVSMCSVETSGAILPAPPQYDLLTLYRQDDADLFALAHADDGCGTSQSLRPGGLFQQFARGVIELFTPRALHASTAVLDVGQGGETETFSDFQFVLPAQLNVLNGIDLGTRAPGDVLSATVTVLDELGAPVPNATVRFTHVPPSGATGGGVTGPSTQCAPDASGVLVCRSDGNGAIPVQWTLSGMSGTNQLSARSVGAGLHASLGGSGPFDSCGPQMISSEHAHCTGTATVPVDRNAGLVTFTATGGQADLAVASVVLLPQSATFADRVTWDVTIVNSGTLPSPATTVAVDGPSGLMGDAGTATLDVPALAPGAVATVRALLGPRVPGTASVTATADPTNTAAESNEANNQVTSSPFTVDPMLTFEKLGDGAPVGDLPVQITGAYAGQRVAFAYRSGLTASGACLFRSNANDPPGAPANHSVSGVGAGCGLGSGVLTITVSGAPTTVTFRLRSNATYIPPVAAVGPMGLPVTVLRSAGTTYTVNDGTLLGTLFREETVTITNTGGIASITVGMIGFTVLVDNLALTLSP